MQISKPPQPATCLWFFKAYEPATERLTFLKAAILPKTMELRNLFPMFARAMGLPEGTDLEVSALGPLAA